MALEKTQLSAAIKAAFEAAQQAPPGDIAGVTQLIADGLATAIDAYVREGEIKGIAVTVTGQGIPPGATGTQTTSVKLQ